MACGGPFVGRAGETFRFCLTDGETVCAGQRVDTDTTTRATIGGPIRYTDQELRQCVTWQLEEGKLYSLLLLCVPPGSTIKARLTVSGQTFEDECTVGGSGSVGPWLIFVASSAAADDAAAEPGEGGDA